jgi:hypothetical protein
LNIPTAIVTNQLFDASPHEICVYSTAEGKFTRKFADQENDVTWYNGNRVDAYYLSPWDCTLVLDADYVISSAQLKKVLSMDCNFAAHKMAYDIIHQDNFDSLNSFGNFNMPMWWATVMMFRKSDEAEMIFDCMLMVKNNWDHYKNLYKISSPMYRNDFALSIALGIVNGHTLDHIAIPWKLASITPSRSLIKLSLDEYRVDFLTHDQKSRYITISNQDFHSMGKRHLGDIVASAIR